MNTFIAKWISNEEFYDLTPIDVFHKETEEKAVPFDEKLADRHILFRRRFTLGRVKKAVVRISADDYYKLYINGRFVSQGPASSYHFHYYYNTLDVTPYLTDGENIIAVHTYYQGLINRVFVSGDRRQGLVFDLTADGKTVLESDETWKCAVHTGYTACGKFGYDTQFAECYDAGAPEVGFEEPCFDDSAWGYAKVKTHDDHVLTAQPTKQLDLYPVNPAAVTRRGNTVAIDLGFEAVGYLTFAAHGNKGDVVTLRFGEELNDDGSVRYKMRCNCDYEEKFILSGRTYDILNEYDYKAFRYAEVILPEGARLDGNTIRVIVRHYPFRLIKPYKGENETLAKIYKLCADTIKYGVQENYVDCPTREKGQYLGDVTIAGIAHMVLTGDASMIRKALENYAESAFICKGLMTVAPAALMQEIADYSLQFPFQVLYVYNYTHDLDFLKRMYPAVMGVYDYFAAYRRENGLIENVKEKWNLVDWPANLRDNYDFPLTKPIGEGFHNVINAFYIRFLKDIDEIRAILGEAPLGVTEKTVRGFIDTFYDEKQHLFVDAPGSSHAAFQSAVVPLFAEVYADEENRRAMIKHIESKKLTSAGTYMAFFALYALQKQGENELAERLMCDEGAWVNMLNEGATTAFEAWGKEQKWNTSLFHPWSACPAILLGN